MWQEADPVAQAAAAAAVAAEGTPAAAAPAPVAAEEEGTPAAVAVVGAGDSACCGERTSAREAGEAQVTSMLPFVRSRSVGTTGVIVHSRCRLLEVT